MKKISEYLFLWGIGGWIYYSLEIIFRGFSHWSMFLLGGICMMFFTYQGELVHWQDDFLRQVLRCSIFVTAMEFITGIIVNKWFALHVWDYSCMPFQLFGQICLPFMILFACLWDLSECQYSAFVIWRRQTTVCEKNYPFKFKI